MNGGWLRAAGAAVVAILAPVTAATHSSEAFCATPEQAQTMSVPDPRPVHEAIQILQSKYGYVITYEDPKYVYKGDLRDVTLEIVNPRYKDITKSMSFFSAGLLPWTKTLVPIGGTVNFRVTDVSSTSAMASVLTELLQSQASLQRDGKFRLEQTGDVFHVVPTEIQDVHGKWQPQKPLLDYTITVPNIADGNVMDMLQAICDALNDASRQHVLLGTVPVNLLFQHRGDLEAHGETARSVLLRANAITKSRLSWSLLYDVGLKAYFLNLSVVRTPERVPSPANDGLKVTTPLAPPSRH